MFRALLCSAIVAAVAPCIAQSSAADDLAPMRRLIGRWEGTAEGQPGRGRAEREYTPLFGERFIQVRHRGTYPPQEKNPKGEVHEDFGVLSFDGSRKRIVLRQFHTEGFVNQYVVDPAAPSDSIVFTTEAIENIPPGWRARETYTFPAADQFEERFELAAPGKEFELYSHTRFTRVR